MGDDKLSDSERLLQLLFKESSLEHFLQRDETAFLLPSFGEYLNAWCRQHGEVPERLIRAANLEKGYGHQLFRDKRNPSRDTVLQLAFAMKADVKQAQEMLKIARKALLYPRIKRDAVLIYCLHNRISLIDTLIVMTDLDLPALGGQDR